MFPVGVSRVVSITGVATVETSILKPPVGFEWIICQMEGWHDDPVARSVYWVVIDTYRGFSAQLQTNTAGINAQDRVPLSPAINYAGQGGYPLKLTNNTYAILHVPTLAAGKKNYIGGIVIERPENLDLFIFENIAAKLGFTLPVVSRY